MPPPRRDARILLVEDNPDDAELVRIAMDEARVSATVTLVTGGEAALEALRNPPGGERYDLVLLDLNLPDLDGRIVLREIKGDPQLAPTLVIVMTTSVDDNDVLRAYGTCANAFVSKPIGFDELIETFSAIEAFWLRTARLPWR